VVIGIDSKRRMFLPDLWRQQTSSNVWIEAWCDLVTKWKPVEGRIEHAGVGGEQQPARLVFQNSRIGSSV